MASVRMEAGSRKESRFSTSSGVIQNNLSASLLDVALKIFLSMEPSTSSFVILNSTKPMLNIVLLFILKKKRILYILAGIIDLLVLYRTKVATVFVEYTGQK